MSVQLSTSMNGYSQADIKLVSSTPSKLFSAGIYDNVPTILSFLSMDDQLKLGSTCKEADELVGIRMSKFYFGKCLTENKRITKIYLASLRKYELQNPSHNSQDLLQAIKDLYVYERSRFMGHVEALRIKNEAQAYLKTAAERFFKSEQEKNSNKSKLQMLDSHLNFLSAKFTKERGYFALTITDDIRIAKNFQDYSKSITFINEMESIKKNYLSNIREIQIAIDERPKNFLGWLVSKINGKTGLLGLIDKIMKFIFRSIREEAEIQNDLNSQLENSSEEFEQAKQKLHRDYGRIALADAKEKLRLDKETFSNLEANQKRLNDEFQKANEHLRAATAASEQAANDAIRIEASLKEAQENSKLAQSALIQVVPEYQAYIKSQDHIKFWEPIFSVFGSELFLNNITYDSTGHSSIMTDKMFVNLTRPSENQVIYDRKNNLVEFSTLNRIPQAVGVGRSTRIISPHQVLSLLEGSIKSNMNNKILKYWLSRIHGHRFKLRTTPLIADS